MRSESHPCTCTISSSIPFHIAAMPFTNVFTDQEIEICEEGVLSG